MPANGAATCDGKVCGIACKPGFTNCAGKCVDLSTDAAHCGSCSASCAQVTQPPNTTGMQCVAGSCTPAACASGYAHCSTNPVTTVGCETSTQNNAGGAGVPCGTCSNALACRCNVCPAPMPPNPPSACVSGVCQP
jgi:hypothetical protein